MSFLEFQTIFREFPIISITEIKKYFPNYDVNALTRWKRKGYINKIKNGYYQFSQTQIEGERELCFVANHIYRPSYVSLQTAMRWYDFIPEGVFMLTSVSTHKTVSFKTPIGTFSYRKIKPSLFFGYRIESIKNHYFKIASPEKTILDYLYLHADIKTEADFYEWRLNSFEIKDAINLNTLDNYLTLFNSKALDKRVKGLLHFLEL